ncbi:MAG: pentapeptide repeat-containing protein [bacterium]
MEKCNYINAATGDACGRNAWAHSTTASKCFWHEERDDKYNLYEGNYKSDLELMAKSGQNLAGFYLGRADLREIDLQNARLERANFQDAFLYGANLRGANLQGADLGRAFLYSADLRGARLENADLGGAFLEHARLQGAMLDNVNLSGAEKLTEDNFGRGHRKYIGEERDGNYIKSKEIYAGLRQHFSADGRYEDARWAAFKENRMDRKIHWQEREAMAYLGSAIMNLLCGYGEKVYRIVLSAIFICLLWSVLYYLLGSFSVEETRIAPSIWDSLYFSVIAFTTAGYGDIHPIGWRTKFLAAGESFIGMFIMMLFIVTLARKVMRL